jgi:ketosteroid isomerase-like protein
MPTTAQLRETVAHYAAVASSRDPVGYAALFTEDAVQVDPYPSGVHTGREEIRTFISQSFDACESMLFEPGEVHPVADKAAFDFHITLGLEGGAVMHIRGIEVFTVDDDGLISAVDAYWGDEDISFD